MSQLKATFRNSHARVRNFILYAYFTALMSVPQFVYADVDGSLRNIRDKLTGTILPLVSVIGIAWAAFSLLTGNENAKKHILYAIVGTAIGFGAEAIMRFIQQAVH
jgi:type IV secretory pathway VirB2 component (pilin)